MSSGRPKLFRSFLMERIYTSCALFILLTAHFLCYSQSDSWQQSHKNGKGKIRVLWHTSHPFIFKTDDDQMTGLEVDILENFRVYLQEQYHVSLSIEYVEMKSFKETYEGVRDHEGTGVIGASAFSITDKRKKEVDFVYPYMKDVSVMISSEDIPIANTVSSFQEIFDNLTAITIAGTTYETDLITLKDSLSLHFKIKYIPSSANVIENIEATKNSFGYVDLPIYLTRYITETNIIKVNRQNLFTVSREGYSLIVNKGNDWKIPLDEFLTRKSNEVLFEEIASRYFDLNIYKFMEEMYKDSTSDLMLLSREKEILNDELFTNTLKLEKERYLRNVFIVSSGIILLFAMVLIWMYLDKRRQNRELEKQKNTIDIQRVNLSEQKNKLENTLKELQQLNDEKNNILKILAHDLRTPINHIKGYTEVMKLDAKNEQPLDHVPFLVKIDAFCDHILKM
ncbi:MAG: transporter substrate-binding domain-containing protein, partial [Cyclobacteriaceae bacterium]|nr:transporter substrate-binding domain-containing protein [Cyclobacteriaceae bacterium]